MSDAVIKCWSCKGSMTLFERSEADGNCPHCRVDIDLEQYLHEALMHPGQQPASVAVPDAVLVDREWLCELQKYVSSFEKQDELRAMIAAAPHSVSGEQKTAFDAEWLVKILDSGEWRLTRFQYDKRLTHEANTRSPWQIERQTPPFCDRQDVSFWRGKTPEQALMAAIWALFPASAQSMGIPFTVCALAAHRAQAQGGAT